MTQQQRSYIGFLPAIFTTLFIIGAAIQVGWIVQTSAYLTAFSAILAAFVLFSSASRQQTLVIVAGILTAAGALSWPFLPESAINIVGLAAMAIGSLLFLVPAISIGKATI